MSLKKRIVCLANSYMGERRCFAGKELIDNEPGSWVRLTTREKDGVPKKDFRDVKPLDIVEVPLLEKHPEGHQKENWLLDTAAPSLWEREYRPWSDPARLVDPVEPLWINQSCTDQRKNNEILPSEIDRVNSSLRFIRVAELTFNTSRGDLAGWFHHDNIEYGLTVTDPDYRVSNSEKINKMGGYFLTVSLAGYHDKTKAYYKLIAAIIPSGKIDTI